MRGILPTRPRACPRRALAIGAPRADHARMALWITHTAEGVELRQDLAGAGSRMVAAAIDLGILLAGLLATLLVLLIAFSFDPTGTGGFALGLVLGGWMLIVVLYWVVFELAWAGQTPGKRALRLRVRSLDGGPVQPLQTLLRGALLLVDLLLVMPLPLGVALVAATPLGQRLGDLAAGTMVVRLPRSGGEGTREPWPGERWSALAQRVLPLAPALAARFTRADVAHLRQLLARGEPAVLSDLEPAARRRLYVAAAREYGARVGVERFDDARVVLRELYLFLREMQPGQNEAAQRTRKSGR
jgi:uncharacterized RDD family membrane protein YckC